MASSTFTEHNQIFSNWLQTELCVKSRHAINLCRHDSGPLRNIVDCIHREIAINILCLLQNGNKASRYFRILFQYRSQLGEIPIGTCAALTSTRLAHLLSLLSIIVIILSIEELYHKRTNKGTKNPKILFILCGNSRKNLNKINFYRLASTTSNLFLSTVFFCPFSPII